MGKVKMHGFSITDGVWKKKVRLLADMKIEKGGDVTNSEFMNTCIESHYKVCGAITMIEDLIHGLDNPPVLRTPDIAKHVKLDLNGILRDLKGGA